MQCWFCQFGSCPCMSDIFIPSFTLSNAKQCLRDKQNPWNRNFNLLICTLQADISLHTFCRHTVLENRREIHKDISDSTTRHSWATPKSLRKKSITCLSNCHNKQHTAAGKRKKSKIVRTGASLGVYRDADCSGRHPPLFCNKWVSAGSSREWVYPAWDLRWLCQAEEVLQDWLYSRWLGYLKNLCHRCNHLWWIFKITFSSYGCLWCPLYRCFLSVDNCQSHEYMVCHQPQPLLSAEDSKFFSLHLSLLEEKNQHNVYPSSGMLVYIVVDFFSTNNEDV